jgi:hypothetical protein
MIFFIYFWLGSQFLSMSAFEFAPLFSCVHTLYFNFNCAYVNIMSHVDC